MSVMVSAFDLGAKVRLPSLIKKKLKSSLGSLPAGLATYWPKLIYSSFIILVFNLLGTTWLKSFQKNVFGQNNCQK